MLTQLRHRLRQWLCPIPGTRHPVDPARMARLELQVQTLHHELRALREAPPDPRVGGDMDAHLGAN